MSTGFILLVYDLDSQFLISKKLCNYINNFSSNVFETWTYKQAHLALKIQEVSCRTKQNFCFSFHITEMDHKGTQCEVRIKYSSVPGQEQTSGML
jgi:hypothetical protein